MEDEIKQEIYYWVDTTKKRFRKSMLYSISFAYSSYSFMAIKYPQ
ncbi:MAG: hypothetical protein ACREA8_03560 [Nitrosotalea sp.]